MVKPTNLDPHAVSIIENKLISNLISSNTYQVVERRDLPSVITERDLQNTDFVKKNIEHEDFAAADQILICRITPIEGYYNIDLKMEKIIDGKIISSASMMVAQNIIDIINSLPTMVIDLISQEYPDSNIINKVKSIPMRSRQTQRVVDANSSGAININKGPIQNILFDENLLIAVSTAANISLNKNIHGFSGRYEEVFDYPNWEITSSNISSRNNLLIAGLADGTICIWDTNEWGSPYQYKFHTEPISSISLSETIISIGYTDGVVDFVDINSFELQYREMVSSHEIKYIFHVNGGFIFIDKYSSLSLYNITSREFMVKNSNHNLKFQSAAISNDKKYLALGYSDGRVKVYLIGDSINTTFVNGKWEKPYIRYNTGYQLNQSVIFLDFSDSDDLFSCLLGDGNVEFIDIMYNNTYYSLNLQSENEEENIIKFIDDYSFVIGTINGNLYHHQLK